MKVVITALSLFPKGGVNFSGKIVKKGGAIVGQVFPPLWSMDFDVKLALVVL